MNRLGINRIILIVGIAIAIAFLFFLTQGIKKIAPSEDEADRQDQLAAQQAQQAPPTPPPPKTQAKMQAASPTLPSEQTIGNPATAKQHLLVGWVYDEANQAKPETLTAPLGAIRDYVEKSGGTVSAEVVNLDVPTEDRSPAAQVVQQLGIVEDGKPLTTGNLSDTPLKLPVLK